MIRQYGMKVGSVVGAYPAISLRLYDLPIELLVAVGVVSSAGALEAPTGALIVIALIVLVVVSAARRLRARTPTIAAIGVRHPSAVATTALAPHTPDERRVRSALGIVPLVLVLSDHSL